MRSTQRAMAGDLVADRYRLARIVGRGGTGIVWLAHDTVGGHDVAIKVADGLTDRGISPDLADAHVRHEGEVGRRVRHQGLPRVHRLVDVNGRAAVVMEYVEGPTLADRLRTGMPLSRAEAARVGMHVAEALASAHEAGIVHGDLSPANIVLMPSGRVVVVDFGLQGDSEIERSLGVHLADPDFAAPERLEGWPPSESSDVWSLAATVFTAVEGRSRGPRSTGRPTLDGHGPDAGRRPAGLLFQHAGPLAPLLGAALHADPDERPSAAYFAERLADLWTMLGEDAPDDEEPALIEPDEVPARVLRSSTLPIASSS